MYTRVVLSACLVLSLFLFTGCAGTSSEQKIDASSASEEAVEQQTPKDSCQAVIDEAVNQARSSMRIAEKTCEGKKIEATPVWGLNYKGEVHVRIYDAGGALLENKYVKP